MARRQMYGWIDPSRKEWRLSQYPPDAPVRPSLAFESMTELMAHADRKRAELHWDHPLTLQQKRQVFTEARDW